MAKNGRIFRYFSILVLALTSFFALKFQFTAAQAAQK